MAELELLRFAREQHKSGLEVKHYEANPLARIEELERRLADLERWALTAQGAGSGLDADLWDGADTPDHARATSNNGQSIPDSVWPPGNVIFEDEVYNTNDEYNPATGNFTAKRSGFLQVTAIIKYATTTDWAAGDRAVLCVCNGANFNVIDEQYAFAGNNVTVVCSGSIILKVATGDVISVRAYQTSGNARLLVSSTEYNFVCFDWLP